MSLGGGEILVILLVALIVFGPQRLPEIGRQVGKAMREVRKMQDSVRDEIHGALKLDEHDHGEHAAAPSYGDQQALPSEHEHGDHTSLPHVDPPTSGSFN